MVELGSNGLGSATGGLLKLFQLYQNIQMVIGHCKNQRWKRRNYAEKMLKVI